MKVRCIDDLGMTVLEVGSVYEGKLKFDHWYKEKRWYLEGEKFRKFCFMEKAFEIVREDNKMQEKTFREVIADIKEGEVWEGKCFKVYIENGKINIDRIIKEKISGYGIILDGKFKLQRKQYTFEEAFKAFERGGEIESAESNYKYSLERDGFLYKPALQDKVIRCSVEDRIFSLDEIQSKWYIND